MRKGVWILVALFVFLLAAGCGRNDETATALPTDMPSPTDSLEPTAPLDSGTIGPAPVCPPARGGGTSSPAVSISSIAFVVNGLEQVVRGDDTLRAGLGDAVQVREVTICTESFPGNGGEACVDFTVVDKRGQEIVSEHAGSHLVRVAPGSASIPGPSHTWTIGENWRHIAVVLNHWPAEETEDLGCASGRCEHDDRIVVLFC